MTDPNDTFKVADDAFNPAPAIGNQHHHAAAIALHSYNRQLRRDETFDAVSARLNALIDDALRGGSEFALDQRLVAQGCVLDVVFNWLIAQAAEDRYDSLRQYHAAFQAQKLYRQVYEKASRLRQPKKSPERTEQKAGTGGAHAQMD